MMTPSRLLCVSNGHGEDAIATRILTALGRHVPGLELAALPLVGTGAAFQRCEIPLIAATKTLPSGGFIYMDSRQLARDLQGGLVSLTWAQLRALRAWAKEGGTVLAVGDLIPALFAWLSGLPYGFVGTAKSAYYLRDEAGLLPGLPKYAGWAGSIYLPWERWVMGHDRCRAVVVRDDFTAAELRALGIQAVLVGNPMMDGLEPTEKGDRLRPAQANALTIALLPGSRAPEAYANWKLIMRAVVTVLTTLQPRPVHLLGAIAPALDLTPMTEILEKMGWQPQCSAPYPTFAQANGTLVLTQDAYSDSLHLADCAIALAGTATEQFVGLGKPAFTLPGAGPQFNPTFAQLQTRLLGASVILVSDPAAMGTVIQNVLSDRDRLQRIQTNGCRRMGAPGAAEAIAIGLRDRLLS